MLVGCDLSTHNNNWDEIIRGNVSFCIIKATEGKTYKNPLMDAMAKEAIARGRLLGFYHYARPENKNTPEAEAAAFVEAVKPYLGNALLALDYEGAAHSCGATWASRWIREVKRLTGVLPLFYTSEAYLHLYGAVAATGCGLWVAKYSTARKPDTAKWPFWALWQWTSYPYDRSYFNGNSKAWKAYARKKK